MYSSSREVEESKRLRYINVFVLLGRDDDLDMVIKAVESSADHWDCKYDVQKSFLGNFYYIKITCRHAQLEDLRNKVESELRKLEGVISWFKTEVIDVK